jgi:uncharacterized membrane protein
VYRCWKLRIFIRSRVTRVTLGLFLATFVFSLIVLVNSRASVASAKQFAPVVSMGTLLTLSVLTVFGFVGYLHNVVRLMRVQYLLEAIAAESRRATPTRLSKTPHHVDCVIPERPASLPPPTCAA